MIELKKAFDQFELAKINKILKKDSLGLLSDPLIAQYAKELTQQARMNSIINRSKPLLLKHTMDDF